MKHIGLIRLSHGSIATQVAVGATLLTLIIVLILGSASYYSTGYDLYMMLIFMPPWATRIGLPYPKIDPNDHHCN